MGEKTEKEGKRDKLIAVNRAEMENIFEKVHDLKFNCFLFSFFKTFPNWVKFPFKHVSNPCFLKIDK